MHSSHWPSARNRKKINNTQSNKNVKLPLTLSYYVIIPFMKTMREKTITSEHVLNDAIKRLPVEKY